MCTYIYIYMWPRLRQPRSEAVKSWLRGWSLRPSHRWLIQESGQVRLCHMPRVCLCRWTACRMMVCACAAKSRVPKSQSENWEIKGFHPSIYVIVIIACVYDTCLCYMYIVCIHIYIYIYIHIHTHIHVCVYIYI